MKGARRPPLTDTVVCPAGGRRRRHLAITADLTGNLPGTREEPGTLTQGGALFSLVPLVWESNPKIQGDWCKAQPKAQRGYGAHPGRGQNYQSSSSDLFTGPQDIFETVTRP
jgi:hypothetical protein